MTKFRILALTYKDFPAALPTVQQAIVDVLKRMGMRVFPDASEYSDGSKTILASGWRRRLQVELEAKGMERTRARVLAKEGVFFEGNAATDLIAQVVLRLEQQREDSSLFHAKGEKASVAILSNCTEPAAIAG
jgi:hypothetical protein